MVSEIKWIFANKSRHISVSIITALLRGPLYECKRRTGHSVVMSWCSGVITEHQNKAAQRDEQIMVPVMSFSGFLSQLISGYGEGVGRPHGTENCARRVSTDGNVCSTSKFSENNALCQPVSYPDVWIQQKSSSNI